MKELHERKEKYKKKTKELYERIELLSTELEVKVDAIPDKGDEEKGAGGKNKEDKGEEMVKEEMGEQPVKLEGCLADDALERNVSLLKKKELGTAYVYTAYAQSAGGQEPSTFVISSQSTTDSRDTYLLKIKEENIDQEHE